MLRAVLFDFDGLILDTETPEVQILREVFEEHGEMFPDSFWINALGRGVDRFEQSPEDLLESLLGRELDKQALHAEIRRRVISLIDAEPVRPGIEALICEARERDLLVGIASSSRHPWVDGHLKRLGLAGLFHAIVCADDVARSKPWPDLYLKLVETLAVPREACFALEDSPNGVKGGKAAGIKVIAVENPLSHMLDLSEADSVVTTLAGSSLDELWQSVGGSPRDDILVS